MSFVELPIDRRDQTLLRPEQLAGKFTLRDIRGERSHGIVDLSMANY
jgi:hypothetical protein